MVEFIEKIHKNTRQTGGVGRRVGIDGRWHGDVGGGKKGTVYDV